MPLIERDALMEELRNILYSETMSKHLSVWECDSTRAGIKKAIALVESAPTIDPVKHGRWIDFRAHDKDWLRDDGKTVFMECSECHEKLCRNLMLSVNFCPSCGCKMGESKLVESHQFKGGDVDG